MSWNRLRNMVLEIPNPSENELRLLMNEIRSFAPDIIESRVWLGYEWFGIWDSLSDKKRAGWVRKWVDIPYHLAESISTHSLNTQTSAISVIEWTPDRVEKVEDFPRMMKLHDLPEYHWILPDITPHDNYTKEQKIILELYAKLEIERVFWDTWSSDVKLISRYIDQDKPDAIEWRKLDISDSGVKALSYEQLWFKDNVAHFHPWVLKALKDDSYYTKLYEILLEREYPTIDHHHQFNTLLMLGWDYDEYRNRMNDILKIRE